MEKKLHNPIRKRSKPDLSVKIYYLAQILSFFIITLLTILLIRFNLQEKEHIVKMNMDRNTMRLMTAYLTDTTDSFISRNPNIKGAVIYEMDGTSILSYGEITRDPRIHKDDDLKLVYIDSKNSLLLSNFIINMQSDFPTGNSRILDNKFKGDNIVFHIEEKNPHFFSDISRLRHIQFVLHLITILIFFQAYRSYRRSIIMKETLESQENLVILGSALRTLTHEMKNPLAAIRLQSGLIQRLYPEDLKEETDVINSEVKRLSRLMETVRDYLKDPVGNQDSIEISSFMMDLKTLYPDEIKWEIPEEIFNIIIDYDKLRSIMENLLNNALESGSVVDKITVKIRRKKRKAYISVRDEGSGIPEEIKRRLYDPFFTTKNNGSGVGLMISKRFLEAANGKINIESAEGVMTEVEISLPLN